MKRRNVQPTGGPFGIAGGPPAGGFVGFHGTTGSTSGSTVTHNSTSLIREVNRFMMRGTTLG